MAAIHEREAAERFDATAREIFAPLYPVMAERILSECGRRAGNCLDIGCGSGWLGMAVAHQSGMELTFCDASAVMLEIASGHIETAGLALRSHCVVGDVHDLPFPDASFDLVVSRGSFPFWENPEKAAAEIFRVLSPGGEAFIGGGFGNAEIQKEIMKKMRERDPAWQERVRSNSVPRAIQRLIEGAFELPGARVAVTRDERGFMTRFGR